MLALLYSVSGIAGELAPAEARLDFYAAASQILPVLLLVLAVEVRAFNLRELRASDRADRILLYIAGFYGIVLLAFFAAAEVTALDALASGHARDGNPELIYRALATAFAAIAAVGIFGRPATRDD